MSTSASDTKSQGSSNNDDATPNPSPGPAAPSASSLAGSLMMLPALYIMNKIDFNAGDNMLYLRVTFFCAQVFCISTVLYIWYTIKTKQDPQKITYKKKASASSWGQPEGSTPVPNIVTCTIQEYDMEQVRAAVQQLVISCVLVCGIHYYWGSAPPLFFQCFMAPKQVLSAPLFRIHGLGHNVLRPFKDPNPNPFASLMPKAPEEPDQDENQETYSSNVDSSSPKADIRKRARKQKPQ